MDGTVYEAHDISTSGLVACMKVQLRLFSTSTLATVDNSICSSKFPVDSGVTLQVLWSFISGRGSMLASFMGKGVTSRAALSLCHLLQTSSRLSLPEVWR